MIERFGMKLEKADARSLAKNVLNMKVMHSQLLRYVSQSPRFMRSNLDLDQRR
jgi:hypothetical protein